MNKRFNASQEQVLDELRRNLQKIDPDCNYLDWIKALMVVFYETKGSDDGLALADEWSSGGQKYRGFQDVEYRWNHFNLSYEKPVRMGTLIHMARK